MSARPQTLLVIGARGLGRELALHFARAGWNVASAARTGAQVAAVAGEVDAAGGQGLGVVADLADPASLRALCEAVATRFGAIDLCVAAQTSGVPFGRRPVLELPPELLARALAAVPQGTLHLIQAVLPRMAAQGSGTFVQMGTGSGLQAREGFALHGAMQAALRALVLVAGRELRGAGVHAAYLAIEGQIESAAAAGYVAKNGLGKTLPPSALCAAVEFLHAQPARAFTHELSVKPAASG